MCHTTCWNVVKRVNGGDLFYPCFWRFHQHNQVIPVCQPPSPLFCVLLTLTSPALATAAAFAHMAPVRVQVSRGAGGSAGHGTAPWGAFCGGTPGALPSMEIWQCCLRAVGPSGEIRLFLEVFVAQPTVIKASMFSKGNEYFAGYVRKNSGT